MIWDFARLNKLPDRRPNYKFACLTAVPKFRKRSTPCRVRSINDRRPKAEDRRPKIEDRRPKTKDQGPKTKGQRPKKTKGQRPRTKDRRPRTKDQRAKSKYQPGTKDQGPNTKDQRPKTNDQRPRPKSKDQRPRTKGQRARPKSKDQRPRTNDQRPKTKDQYQWPRTNGQRPKTKERCHCYFASRYECPVAESHSTKVPMRVRRVEYTKQDAHPLFIAMGWDTEGSLCPPSKPDCLDIDLSLVPLDVQKNPWRHKTVSYRDQQPHTLGCTSAGRYGKDYQWSGAHLGMSAYTYDRSGDMPGDDEAWRSTSLASTASTPMSMPSLSRRTSSRPVDWLGPKSIPHMFVWFLAAPLGLTIRGQHNRIPRSHLLNAFVLNTRGAPKMIANILKNTPKMI